MAGNARQGAPIKQAPGDEDVRVTRARRPGVPGQSQRAPPSAPTLEFRRRLGKTQLDQRRDGSQHRVDRVGAAAWFGLDRHLEQPALASVENRRSAQIASLPDHAAHRQLVCEAQLVTRILAVASEQVAVPARGTQIDMPAFAPDLANHRSFVRQRGRQPTRQQVEQLAPRRGSLGSPLRRVTAAVHRAGKL